MEPLSPSLCKGNHNFQVDITNNQMKCTRCPIVLTRIELMINGKEGRKLVAEKEREWYIKELES